jgi:hypothetical protein
MTPLFNTITMYRFWNFVPLAAIISLLTLPACDSAESDELVPVEIVVAEDIPADPPTGRDPETGAPIGTTGGFTFFSLRENQIVLNHTSDDRSDSTSTDWDLAFRSTTILVNGGNSGPGQGGMQILNQEFEDVTEAPEAGYSTDPVGARGGNSTWYVYDPQSMTVFPLAPQTLIVRTADGRYAKVEIVSYYRGAPEVPNPFTDQERYYTLRFAYQPDGSRQFE